MKRQSIILAAFLILLCSCGGQKETPTVSMLVTQGFKQPFYLALAEDVKTDLGIDLEFVYENAQSQTSAIVQDFIHNDLKADIIFICCEVPGENLKDCCLDFASQSDLTSHYSYSQIKEVMEDDGSIYTLPLSSRLIGITYNATLFREKGWEVPSNYQEMLELKKKSDEAGCVFAITDLRYTGHSFNYLFHLMGAQWLSTVKGKIWFDGFIKGTKTLHVFKENADYFRRWVENGLFGELADFSGDAMKQFGQRRALFGYSTTNSLAGYSGPMYDRDGHETGVMLNDEFRSMPWISEDGSNNCFTRYDNCWVMVNKAVADDKDKLANTLAVLDYMMSEKYSKMAASEGEDIYVAFGNQEIEEDRLYYYYADDIKRGFLQPWYYNDFEEATIIETGTEIASYIVSTYMQNGWLYKDVRHMNYTFRPNANFDTAIGMLRNSLHAQKEDYLGWAEEAIESPEIARMVAISCGMALQDAVPEEEVNVALLPYANSYKDIKPWEKVPVQNIRVKRGVLHKGYSYIFEPPACTDVVGIRMTGRRIKEIVARGYKTYPYACETKGRMTLDDNKEYVVALCPNTLEDGVYDEFAAAGKVLVSEGKPITNNLSQGVVLYFQQHPSISNTNISWE